MKCKEKLLELDSYQTIIDGCKQVVDNYKPTIEIDPSWQMVKLGEIADFKYGLNESALETGTHRFVRITDISQFGLLKPADKKYVTIAPNLQEYILSKGDILIARTGATYGKCLYFEDDEPSAFAGYLIKVNLSKIVIPKYFWIFSQSENFDYQKKNLVVGGGQPQFNANALENIIVPIPPLDEQIKIINEVINEQKIIAGNLSLVDTFASKIKNKINAL